MAGNYKDVLWRIVSNNLDKALMNLPTNPSGDLMKLIDIYKYGTQEERDRVYNQNMAQARKDYAEHYGLDQLDTFNNSALAYQKQRAIETMDENYTMDLLEGWNNANNARLQQERENNYYSIAKNSLIEAGYNPILATQNGLSLSSAQTAAQLSSNRTAELYYKEQNKLTRQVISTLGDIVKRLVPDLRGVNAHVTKKVKFD